jgi:thioredoxin-like negative regulator of GroEL
VVARLLQEVARWSGDPESLLEAIDKVERAWALDSDPEIAIQLAVLYDRVNRNDEALVVLREASRKHPDMPACATTRR